MSIVASYGRNCGKCDRPFVTHNPVEQLCRRCAAEQMVGVGVSDAYTDSARQIVCRAYQDKPSGIYLTHNECNVLMHGLRDADDDVLHLKPEAQRVYERLVRQIIDAGTEPSGASEPALLNELAAECHRLAKARGKYSRWNALIGRNAIQSELNEWYAEASFAEDYPNDTAYHDEEYGDVLHAVLSVGHQMGYDVDEALRGAMKRNRRREEEGA